MFQTLFRTTKGWTPCIERTMSFILRMIFVKPQLRWKVVYLPRCTTSKKGEIFQYWTEGKKAFEQKNIEKFAKCYF